MLTVNGVAIPEPVVLMELRRLITFYSQHISRDELGRRMPLLMHKAKEQAIGAKLLLDEAVRLKIEVTDAEIAERVSQMATEAGGPEAFDRVLQKQRISRAALHESIRNGKRIDQLVARITAHVPAPTEEEARAFHEAHQDEFVSADRAVFRHILIKPASASDADRAATRSKLLEMKAQIEQGRDLAELAAAYSECPSGKQTGGSLGWIAHGQTVPAFDQAAFPLKVGETSDVVETPLGFHLIQKAQEERGKVLAYDDVQDKVRDFMIHARRGEAIAAYVRRLRAEVVVEDDEDEALADPPPDEATEDLLEGEEDDLDDEGGRC